MTTHPIDQLAHDRMSALLREADQARLARTSRATRPASAGLVAGLARLAAAVRRARAITPAVTTGAAD